MTLTDTHCHLDMERFDGDRQAVIARATAAGVNHMLIPALDLGSARRGIDLAAAHPTIFAAVGVHPTEATDLHESDLVTLSGLALAHKVKAIGEIGLDYYWVTDQAQRDRQREALRAQLEIARECGLPVVLHLREQYDADHGACADDLLVILDEWVRDLQSRTSTLVGRAGVLHSFAGNMLNAIQAIRLGFYIGVTGPITYPRAEGRRELVRQLPLDRLLIETDAPFLAPLPHRGRRNEPAYVTHIADRIADIQSRTPKEVAEATSSNAGRLFAWGESV